MVSHFWICTSQFQNSDCGYSLFMSLVWDKRSLFSSASDRLSAGCHRVGGSLWKLASAHWSFLTAFWKQCGETRYHGTYCTYSDILKVHMFFQLFSLFFSLRNFTEMSFFLFKESCLKVNGTSQNPTTFQWKLQVKQTSWLIKES